MTAFFGPLDSFEDSASPVRSAPVLPGLTESQMVVLLRSLDEARVRAERVVADVERTASDHGDEGHDASEPVRRAQMRLAAIESAYRRIGDGMHNTCAACGDPVGAERLASIPETDRCVACARANPPGTTVVSCS